MFRRKKKYFVRVTTVMAVCAVAIGIFALYQMRVFNDSVLEIYAGQQDSYVQLVLDQINLQYDREDDEMISDILGSLNTSNEKYWTLTKDEEFLFVKDVSETNRYKGFTAESYYLSDSAKAFVEHLQTDRVTHAAIDMDGDRYVASGTEFSYLGGTYKICLLTYDKVILESNRYLQSRITILILLFALMLVLLVVAMVFSEALDARIRKINALEERVKKQNITIEGLEDRLTIETSYHASDSIFHGKVIVDFLEKLEERNVHPIVLAFVSAGEEDRAALVRRIDEQTGKKYLKFAVDGEHLLLLYPNADEGVVAEKLGAVAGLTLLGTYRITDDYNAYVSQYEKFKKKVLPDG